MAKTSKNKKSVTPKKAKKPNGIMKTPPIKANSAENRFTRVGKVDFTQLYEAHRK